MNKYVIRNILGYAIGKQWGKQVVKKDCKEHIFKREYIWDADYYYICEGCGLSIKQENFENFIKKQIRKKKLNNLKNKEEK